MCFCPFPISFLFKKDYVAIMSQLCRDYVASMSRLCRDYVVSRLCRGYVATMSRLCRDNVATMSRLCRARYCLFLVSGRTHFWWILVALCAYFAPIASCICFSLRHVQLYCFLLFSGRTDFWWSLVALCASFASVAFCFFSSPRPTFLVFCFLDVRISGGFWWLVRFFCARCVLFFLRHVQLCLFSFFVFWTYRFLVGSGGFVRFFCAPCVLFFLFVTYNRSCFSFLISGRTDFCWILVALCASFATVALYFLASSRTTFLVFPFVVFWTYKFLVDPGGFVRLFCARCVLFSLFVTYNFSSVSFFVFWTYKFLVGSGGFVRFLSARCVLFFLFVTHTFSCFPLLFSGRTDFWWILVAFALPLHPLRFVFSSSRTTCRAFIFVHVAHSTRVSTCRTMALDDNNFFLIKKQSVATTS